MSVATVAGSQLPLTQGHVLAVDDDAACLRLVRDLLEPLSLEVCAARSAEEALELMQRRTPDLLLLDRSLPGMGGIALVAHVRSHAKLASIPIIMATCYASADDIRQGMDAGATYYLTKPLDHDLLRGVVCTAIRSSGIMTSARARTTSQLLHGMRDGLFEFRTMQEARQMALELGSLCPNPEVATMGLTELMVNAIEHGNLEISYEEKGDLCRFGRWQAEVARRSALPVYGDRRATLWWARRRDLIRFEIRDEGPGFDWRRFMSFEPERAFDPNGRGIALARGMAFSNLHYEEPGNVVIAEIPLCEQS